MLDVAALAEMILTQRTRVSADQSMLVAVSGIDAAGKGHVTDLIVAALRQAGVKTIAINADRWLNLPARRFSKDRPAEHFYHHAFRFDDLFEQLILPLKRTRSVRVEVNVVDETSQAYYRHLYEFDDVDVIVLEGVYLLKAALRNYYDLTIWLECSFKTALERGLQRGQEGLPPAETDLAYETIYFPAERIHFAVDDPQSAADVIVTNDPRLEFNRQSVETK